MNPPGLLFVINTEGTAVDLWVFKVPLKASTVLIILSLYDKPNSTELLLGDTESHLTKGYFKINVTIPLR